MVDVLSRLRPVDGPEPTIGTGSSEPCSPFWEKFNAVEANINAIALSVDDVRRAQDDLNSCTDNARANSMREQIEGTLRDCTQRAQSIRGDIDLLDRQIRQLEEESPGSPEVRLQQNHFHLLKNRFGDVVSNFTELSKEIKAKFVKTVTRQFNIAGVALDESKVEQIILEQPEMLQQNIFQLRGGQQMKEITETYNTIASRHQAILDIERRVNEVLDLFVQFAIVVRDQGRMIDNIGQNVATARDYVEQGLIEIEKAKEHQKTNRKCLWIMVIVGIVLLIVAIVLAVTMTS
jgi:t-SNARE complex subunit (syntaxin)